MSTRCRTQQKLSRYISILYSVPSRNVLSSWHSKRSHCQTAQKALEKIKYIHTITEQITFVLAAAKPSGCLWKAWKNAVAFKIMVTCHSENKTLSIVTRVPCQVTTRPCPTSTPTPPPPPPHTLHTLNSVRKPNLRYVRTFIQLVSIIAHFHLYRPMNHLGLRKMQIHYGKFSRNFAYSVTPLQILVAAKFMEPHSKVVASNHGWAFYVFLWPASPQSVPQLAYLQTRSLLAYGLINRGRLGEVRKTDSKRSEKIRYRRRRPPPRQIGLPPCNTLGDQEVLLHTQF
jgi:hypothetical protein